MRSWIQSSVLVVATCSVGCQGANKVSDPVVGEDGQRAEAAQDMGQSLDLSRMEDSSAPLADMGAQSAQDMSNTDMGSEVTGALDKEVIRSVIKQHITKIKYCYEKQLQKNPKLAGTVKVKFVIAGTGSVMSATISSTSLHNSAVEQCITNEIRGWVFPEPTGGGIVNVNYPFKFSS